MKRKIKINDMFLDNYFSSYISVSGDAHITIDDMEVAELLFQRFSQEDIVSISLCDAEDSPIISLTLTEEAQIRMVSLEDQEIKLTINARGVVEWK